MENEINKREELLQLDKEKKKLEERISELIDYLSGPGMPGIDGSLIDKDGFPKQGLDLVSIREARHELIYKQNDLKFLMEKIEKKMMIYFEELSKNKKEKFLDDENCIKNKNINQKEETTADACGEEEKNQQEKNLREPFAKIVNVEKGSPADEAGLKPEDDIIVFNGILYKGASHNPLNTLADIVRNKIGQQIPISIVRKNSDNILQVVNLDIIPHTWNGKGVLGCKFQIIP